MSQETPQTVDSLAISEFSLPSISGSPSQDEVFDNILLVLFKSFNLCDGTAIQQINNRDSLIGVIKSSIESISDNNKLFKCISECNKRYAYTLQIKEVFDVPFEILLGLMLLNIKNQSKDNFKYLIEKNLLGMNIRSCENYMKTAKIIDYPELYKYLAAGSMTIRRIVDIITSKEGKRKYSKCKDAIAYAFSVISKEKSLCDGDYARMAQYVAFYHTKFKKQAKKDDLYYDLYKTGYKITNTDANFICSLSYTNNANSKNGKSFNPNILTKYIVNLLTYELNRDLAKQACISGVQAQASQIKQSETRITEFNTGIESLIETIDYINKNNNNFKIDNERKEATKQLIDALSALYKKSFPN